MNQDLYERAMDCISMVPGRMCFTTPEMRHEGMLLFDDLIEALVQLGGGDDEAIERRIDSDIRELLKWSVRSL